MVEENLSIRFRRVSGTEAPWSLLLEADPSEEKVKAYLPSSDCYVAELSGEVAGVYVLKAVDRATIELLNIAVKPALQGRGLGKLLLQHAIATAKAQGAGRMEIGTGTFGYQLAFYQKAGFRVSAIERDFFLNQYDEPLFEAGIQHKDRLILALEL